VQHAGDRPERTGFNRVDHRADALAPCDRKRHVVRRSVSALGDMSCRPALARIDDFAREQGIARSDKARFLGARLERVDCIPVEMGLRPVEEDARSLESQARQTIRFGREQLVQPLDLDRLLSGRHRPSLIIRTLPKATPA
jgi:hypothetical protein